MVRRHQSDFRGTSGVVVQCSQYAGDGDVHADRWLHQRHRALTVSLICGRDLPVRYPKMRRLLFETAGLGLDQFHGWPETGGPTAPSFSCSVTVKCRRIERRAAENCHSVRMRRMRASSGSGDPGLTGSKRCFCEATFLCLSLRYTLLKPRLDEYVRVGSIVRLCG